MILHKVPPRRIWGRTPPLSSVKVQLWVNFLLMMSLLVDSRLVHIGRQLTARRVTEDPLQQAANQTLLAASIYSDNFNSTNFGADGIMGMGFKEISPFKAAPFFETLVDQGQLKEPVFGFYLAESDSELIIGGRDSSRYSGNLTYVNVEKQVRILRGI